jgi:hypothetical protein
MNDKEYTNEQIRAMWPQARGELSGFAKALMKNSGITAAQLRMAIQLADEAFNKLKEADKDIFKKMAIPENRKEYNDDGEGGLPPYKQ